MRNDGLDAQTLEGGFEAWKAGGQLLVRTDKLPPRDERGRTVWVTRARPKVDRIACPWLIRRFIDPKAVFLFVAPSEVLPVAERFQATPFDIDGVFWSHRGETCTFDTMLEEFRLKSPPLQQLALIVRGADTAGPRPCAAVSGSAGGVARLSRMYRDDLAQLEAAWRSMMPSTGGAATPPRRRTTGRRPSPGLSGDDVNDTVAPIAVGGAKPPTFREALGVWTRIGLLSFGGPAGQIALMHRVLVEERKWIDEPRYLNALNFCMLLPGPEAMQLATYVGWRLHGIEGRAGGGPAVRHPGRAGRAGAVDDLCRVRQGARRWRPCSSA